MFYPWYTEYINTLSVLCSCLELCTIHYRFVLKKKEVDYVQTGRTPLIYSHC